MTENNPFLGIERLAEMELRVNGLLGLDSQHEFGWHFVSRYIDKPYAYSVEPEYFEGKYVSPETDYKSMCKWISDIGIMYAGGKWEYIDLSRWQHIKLRLFLIWISKTLDVSLDY